jgi:hypothetical protein
LTIIEQIAEAISEKPPVFAKDIGNFVRRANKKLSKKFNELSPEAQLFLNEATLALKKRQSLAVPDDFVEGEEPEEDDKKPTESEKEEDEWLSVHKMEGQTKTVNLTVKVILEMVKSGDLKIPDFQREFVWPKKNGQEFLCSLLNCLLIPFVTFARDPREKEQDQCILDGLQRISTLVQFIDEGSLTLGANSPYPNKKFKDLPKDVRDTFLRKVIAVNEIECLPKYWPGLFRLINKGGMQLKPMEIRRAIFRHSVMFKLEDITKNHIKWRDLFGKDNKRRAGLEALLRAVAMSESYATYSKPMEHFLNGFCSQFKQQTIDAELLGKRLNTILQALSLSCPKTAFRVKESAKNLGMVDCLIHGGLTYLKVVDENVDLDTLGEVLKELRNKLIACPDPLNPSPQYLAVTKDTSGTSAVQVRMRFVEDFIMSIGLQGAA